MCVLHFTFHEDVRDVGFEESVAYRVKAEVLIERYRLYLGVQAELGGALGLCISLHLRHEVLAETLAALKGKFATHSGTR